MKNQNVKVWFRSGTPWVWLTASAVTISVIMVIGLLLLIMVRGLGYFWPAAVHEFSYDEPDKGNITVIGEIYDEEVVGVARLKEAGLAFPQDASEVTRYLIKIGNRELNSLDFRWIDDFRIELQKQPEQIFVAERREWGNFYGYLEAIKESGEVVAQGQAAWSSLWQRLARADKIFSEIREVEKHDIGAINYQLEKVRLRERQAKLENDNDTQLLSRFSQQRAKLNAEYESLMGKLAQLNQDIARDSITARTSDGQVVEIALSNIIGIHLPNQMSVWSKAYFYIKNLKNFIVGEPREANTEGGIFPAIFGTVLMVLIMSVIVTPFGVVAAIYLREYAKQGFVTRTIRIAVNNLAGVPSIVYGIFGLGFFVYFLGGNIDQLFYPEVLPAPTFGTPGILWASLTLAILTVPVVIVATEEGLSRIPRSMREGSLALGATKWETLWRTILPVASPAIMTGLILAVARAAGEVAPLMLVGVVKLAPSLPLDGNFPFLHLDRKFMHLGFHIYDVGFQSPNVEAARPLVYATALLLVIVIILLNLTAIAIRNRLREKFKALDH